uniref:Uncharacterized protein n=1 Tax=Triticum urartu TaxID=4572 RepID=A0A8R7PVK6_TRIUA
MQSMGRNHGLQILLTWKGKTAAGFDDIGTVGEGVLGARLEMLLASWLVFGDQCKFNQNDFQCLNIAAAPVQYTLEEGFGKTDPMCQLCSTKCGAWF